MGVLESGLVGGFDVLAGVLVGVGGNSGRSVRVSLGGSVGVSRCECVDGSFGESVVGRFAGGFGRSLGRCSGRSCWGVGRGLHRGG